MTQQIGADYQWGSGLRSPSGATTDRFSDQSTPSNFEHLVVPIKGRVGELQQSPLSIWSSDRPTGLEVGRSLDRSKRPVDTKQFRASCSSHQGPRRRSAAVPSLHLEQPRPTDLEVGRSGDRSKRPVDKKQFRASCSSHQEARRRSAAVLSLH